MADLRTSLLRNRAPNKRLMARHNDCTPVKWDKYFENEQSLLIDGEKFHIYMKGDTGPLLLPLHGGGYSGLTWALFVEEITRKIDCQVVVPDLRGHGNTEADDSDLSLHTMANDVAKIVEALYGSDPPCIILIGHSMGGAVAVEAASLIPTVRGLCVIDVVEGTALESLSSMQSILRGRPTSFKSIEQAILWSYKGGQTHNLEAARVSMPGQIKNKTTGVLAANEVDQVRQSSEEDVAKRFAPGPMGNVINEEPEEEDEFVSEKPPLPPSAHASPNVNGCTARFQQPQAGPSYVWRIDLSKTEVFWTGWFKGLSQKFLDLPLPKVLLLANIQGLDTALTIGQMQGKFQMQVLARSGHAIHEDNPGQVADILGGYLVKQKLAAPSEGFTPVMPAC